MNNSIFALLFFLSFFSSADTFIVSDNGKTVPLRSYISSDSSRESATQKYNMDELEREIEEKFPLNATIPLRKVNSYSLPGIFNLPTSRAIALIGTGHIDQVWLNQRMGELRRINATIIVIDSESYNLFSRFEHSLSKAGFETLWMSSKPFEGIAKGYPVIIHQGKVYQ